MCFRAHTYFCLFLVRELIKHFFVYGLGATIGKFLSVLLLPIYASVFTPEDYGCLDLILTLSTIVSVFGMMQLETGLQRFYYEYKNNKNRCILVSTALVATTVITLFFTILSLIFIPLISESFLEGKYQIELIVSFLSMLPLNVLTIIFVDLRYRDKSVVYMILTVTQVLLSAVAAIVAVKVFNFGIMGVIAANTLTQFLIMGVAFIIWSHWGGKMLINVKMLKKMFSFGLPQFPARLGSISNSYINRFFMVSMLTVSAIGIYSVSLKISSAFQLIQMAFQLAWLPFLYKTLTEPDHREKIVRYYKEIIFVVSIFVFIFSLYSEEITLLLTNESYQDASHYVPLLSFYFSLFILKEIVDVGVNVTKKSKYTSYIFGVATVVNIVLLYFLTPRLSIYGVALALLLSNFVLFYLTLIVSERLYPVHFPIKMTVVIHTGLLIVLLVVSYYHIPLIVKLGLTFGAFLVLFFRYKTTIWMMVEHSKKKNN